MAGYAAPARVACFDMDNSVPAAVRGSEDYLAFDTTRRWLLGGGWLLVLLGSASGFIAPVTPAVGVAHKVGLMEGILLIAAAGSWHILHLDSDGLYVVMALLLSHAFCNWLGCVMAALTQSSANLMDPTFTCSMTNTSLVVNYMVRFLLNMALLIIPAVPLLIYGTFAKQNSPQMPMRIASYVLTGLAFVAIISFTFFESPVDTELTQMRSVSPAHAGPHVKKLAYCPYAVISRDNLQQR